MGSQEGSDAISSAGSRMSHGGRVVFMLQGWRDVNQAHWWQDQLGIVSQQHLAPLRSAEP